MCCEPIEQIPDAEDEIGECPDCGTETVNGEARYGCYYSPVACSTCGWKPCDQSC